MPKIAFFSENSPDKKKRKVSQVAIQSREKKNFFRQNQKNPQSSETQRTREKERTEEDMEERLSKTEEERRSVLKVDESREREES